MAQITSTWYAAVPLLVLLAGVALLAMDERSRKKFAPREGLFDHDGKPLFATLVDLNGMGEKVTATLTLLSSQRDQWDAVERAVDRLTITQEQQRERVSEQLAQTARTLERVAVQLESVSHAQIEQSVLLKRLLKEGVQ